MTSVNKGRARKDGSFAYQVAVRTAGSKQFKTFDDREEAELYAASMRMDIEAAKLKKALATRRRMTGGPSMQGLVVSNSEELAMKRDEAQRMFDGERLFDTIEAYLKTLDKSGSRYCMVRAVRDTVGLVKHCELKPRWVREYIDYMRSKPNQHGGQYAYSTISDFVGYANHALAWRTEQLDIPLVKVPLDRKKMFPKGWNKGRERRLERGEQAAIQRRLRRIKGPTNRHYRLFFHFALETAARLQEMAQAEWSEFDLDRRLWNMPAEHTKMKKARVVPLTRRAMRILRILHRIKDASRTRVFHALPAKQSVSSFYQVAFRDAGVNSLHLHDLRHEAISRIVLKQRNLSVFEIMKFVGHETIEMLNRYTHIRGDELVAKLI